MSRAATATIHLGALRHNLERARALAGGSRVMAVVKADAYGHGLERAFRALRDADAFGVASVQDGQRLRAAGARQRIVVLSGVHEAGELAAARRLRLEPVIHHRDQVDLIERDDDPAALAVWVKIDTGMHRLGFDPDEVPAVADRLAALPALTGRIAWMTHFAASDEPENPITARQIASFAEATAGRVGERSLANSAGLVAFPAAHADWVRVGGLLYGVSAFADRCGSELGFRPAMSLATRLISIKRVARGERIGYAGSYQCPVDMDVGIAAIGYGDGYPRHAGAGSVVLVDGQSAPVVGRVSMDLVAVDVSRVVSARIGSKVLLWGPELPVEQVAAAAGTIGYDLICGVTRRVLFVDDDEGPGP